MTSSEYVIDRMINHFGWSLTPAHLAELLNMDVGTVVERLDQGLIPYSEVSKPGSQRVERRTSLQQYLEWDAAGGTAQFREPAETPKAPRPPARPHGSHAARRRQREALLAGA